MLKKQDMNIFIKGYSRKFPNETKPSLSKIKIFREMAYVSLESKYNLFYVMKIGNRYSMIAGYCIASKDDSKLDIYRCFKEALQFLRSFDGGLLTSNLNIKYYKVSKPLLNNEREF